MERPEFDVNISKTGQVTVRVVGVKGPRCLEYADLIKEIVGREEQRELTTEYYAPDTKVRINAEVRERSGP
ncbi:MAG: DUF2997 domain-containing protein [Planctomycetes bacterium]|nr:DUF2997 domain-containing protein [Planctomycetota bacterium]